MPAGFPSPASNGEIGERYEHRFGNIDEVAHPSIMFDARFGILMALALSRGEILSRGAVVAEFGEIGWEE